MAFNVDCCEFNNLVAVDKADLRISVDPHGHNASVGCGAFRLCVRYQ
jgi:hypothetical protein